MRLTNYWLSDRHELTTLVRLSRLGWLPSSSVWELVRKRCDPAAAPPHVRFEPMATDAARGVDDRYSGIAFMATTHYVTVRLISSYRLGTSRGSIHENVRRWVSLWTCAVSHDRAS